MNKLTAIRIKYDDGTYSDEIPISTLAEYILWDDSHNLVDILGNIDMSKGTVQAQLNEKIDDEALAQYLRDEISTDVTNWLNTYVTPVGSAVIVDSSLTTEGAAADAKKTGDELSELNERLEQISEVVDTETKDIYEYTPVEFNLGEGSWTNHGVVFTQNNDGTISAVGTNTHTTGIIFGIRSSSAELTIPLTAGEKYRLTGCPTGGAASDGYSLTIRYASGGGALFRDIGEGAVFDVPETTTYKIHITVAQGLTINKVFEPKLEKMTVISHETVDVLTAKDTVARNGKIDKQQGVENAGKALIVGSDGMVVPSDTITGAVRYNTAQTLTDENKFQARENIGANAIYISNNTRTIYVGNDDENIQNYYWGNGGLVDVTPNPLESLRNTYYAISDLIPVNAGDIVNLYDFGLFTIKKTSLSDQYSSAIIGMYDGNGNDSPGRVNLSSEYVTEYDLEPIEEPTTDISGFGKLQYVSITIPDGCTQIGLFYVREYHGRYEYISNSNPKYEIMRSQSTVTIHPSVVNEFKSIASDVYDEKQKPSEYHNKFIEEIQDEFLNIGWAYNRTEDVVFNTSLNRIGTGVLYIVDYDLHLSANSGYELSVMKVTSTEAPVAKTDLISIEGWVSDVYIKKGTAFYFQIRKTNNSNIDPSEHSAALTSDISNIKLTNVFDLCLFAGQSNMAGRGITNQQWPDSAPVILPNAGLEYKAISAPLYMDTIIEPFGVKENNSNGIDDGNLKTGSMVTAFVNAYYSNNGNIPVLAVSASKGGSGINEWQPNTPYLNDAISRLNSAKNFAVSRGYTIRHIFLVWCQGEHEGDTSTITDDEAYITSFETMFTALKAVGVEKCFLCRIGEYNGTGTDYSRVIEKQTELAKENKDIVMVTTTLASFKSRGLMKDLFHFYQTGYNEMGEYAGINAAYYVTTGKEPTMYDPKYNNLYYSKTN